MKDAKQWIAWIIATATAALTMTSFVYSTFETKEHSKEVKEDTRNILNEIRADVKELKQELIRK